MSEQREAILVREWDQKAAERRALAKERSREVPADLKADDLGNYFQYTALIAVWGTLVAAYVIVLEKAVRDHDYLGARGSQARARSFDVLAFFRIVFATVHVPVVVSVLASTIPYWTMFRTVQQPRSDSVVEQEVGHGVSAGNNITQLFYLADRTWAGLVGWGATCRNSFLVRRPSLTWFHLALVVALAYVGFPLLSVAYVIHSQQYWETQQIPAATALGGHDQSFQTALDNMYDLSKWVGEGVFATTADFDIPLGELALFNSSQVTTGEYAGLAFDTFTFNTSWSNGHAILTLPLTASGNAQLPAAALQISALCTSAGYNNSVYVPSQSTVPESRLTFDFNEVDPAEKSGLPYKLSCKQSCDNSTFNDTSPNCYSNSSTRVLWPSDDNRRTSQDVGGDPNKLAGPKFTGQTLSCGLTSSSDSELEASAHIQFAVQGPGSWTSVRTCNLSIAYVKPTINTLIGQYMQATTIQAPSSSLIQAQGLTPHQLMMLSVAGPLKLFHDGPPPPADISMAVSDGFKWVSWVSEDGSHQINATNFEPGGFCAINGYNPWDLLYIQTAETYGGMQGAYYIMPEGNDLFRPGHFDESIFLKPLASIISRPEFFTNGTTAGVAFKTDLVMAHGKVPYPLAIAVLMLPILWTILLSLTSIRHSRWTGSLDAFAMFKLGGDWRGNLKDLRLASLSQAKKELESIPGMVRVDPAKGIAELDNPPRRTYSEPRET